MIELAHNDQIPTEFLATKFRPAESGDLNRIVELGNRGFGLGVHNLATRLTYYLVPLLMPTFSLAELCGEPTFTAFERGMKTYGRIQPASGMHVFEVRNSQRGGWQPLFKDGQTILYILK